MKYLKETEEFFNEFLRKYENGEIPKEPWESEPPPELHIFGFRKKTTPQPNPTPESSEKE